MKGFGEPIHYSVFRCDLTPKGRVEMIAALTDLIKQDRTGL
jgi:CRISPR-associated protein Cas2